MPQMTPETASLVRRLEERAADHFEVMQDCVDVPPCEPWWRREARASLFQKHEADYKLLRDAAARLRGEAGTAQPSADV